MQISKKIFLGVLMRVKEEEEFIKLRENMVKNQIISRGIQDKKVIAAMKKVPRHLFVEKSYEDSAYSDYPLPIGFNQTISQPYIVALMTELLELDSNDKVLEIGTGSGYQTAIIAEIAKEIYTIELVKELSERAKKILDSLGYKNIYFKCDDGHKGWPEKAPFNKIIVTAAPRKIPENLVDQLDYNGIMVMPLGESLYNQTLFRYKKINNNLVKEEICGVAFVPMVTSRKFDEQS